MFLKTEILVKRQILILTFVLCLFLFFCGSSFAEVRVFFSPKGGIADEVIKQIDNAQEYIDIAMYSFTYEPIAEAIIRAKNQGVKIRIFMDHYKGSVYQFLLDNGLDNGGPAKQVTADRDKEECNNCNDY